MQKIMRAMIVIVAATILAVTSVMAFAAAKSHTPTPVARTASNPSTTVKPSSTEQPDTAEKNDGAVESGTDTEKPDANEAPGGHEDPPGNVDHQCNGNCTE